MSNVQRWCQPDNVGVGLLVEFKDVIIMVYSISGTFYSQGCLMKSYCEVSPETEDGILSSVNMHNCVISISFFFCLKCEWYNVNLWIEYKASIIKISKFCCAVARHYQFYHWINNNNNRQIWQINVIILTYHKPTLNIDGTNKYINF